MSKIDSAILMAGRGSRLSPLTDDIPKPMIKLFGKKLYEHSLEQLSQIDFDLKAVNAHHRAEEIEQEFRGGKVKVVTEKILRGTGGGISGLKKHLKSDPYMIANSDVIWSADLKDALDQFRQKAIALMLIAMPNEDGELWINRKNQIFFIENTGMQKAKEEASWRATFCGIHLISNAISLRIPEEENFCIVRGFYKKLIEEKEYPIAYKAKKFYDLGTFERIFSFYKKYEESSNLNKASFEGDLFNTYGEGKLLGGKGSRLENVVILGDVEIESGAQIKNSILSEKYGILPF